MTKFSKTFMKPTISVKMLLESQWCNGTTTKKTSGTLGKPTLGNLLLDIFHTTKMKNFQANHKFGLMRNPDFCMVLKSLFVPVKVHITIPSSNWKIAQFVPKQKIHKFLIRKFSDAGVGYWWVFVFSHQSSHNNTFVNSKYKVLFTDHWRWQNFRLSLLRLVKTV